METNKYYNRLKELKDQFPKLTFHNNGYEYLSHEIKEKHKEQIKEITEILKTTVKGFSRFDNFKPLKNGSFDIRIQYNWNYEGGNTFIGVGYFNIKEFKNFKK